MQTNNETIPSLGKGKTSSLSKLQRDIEAALANRRKTVADQIADAFEDLEEAMKNGIAQKVLMEMFNKNYGAKLHPARFRKLMENERARRASISGASITYTAETHQEGI